jgi:hypothetical protein
MQERGGKRFDEDQVTAIIRNPVYKGCIRYGGALYPAKHEAIVDEETWDQANRAIGNGHEETGTLKFKDDHVHLLKGILRCGSCGMAMTPYPSGKKTKDCTPYLYYACVNFTKDGRASPCLVRQLPAREFETLIKAVLADLGTNEAILRVCVEAANREAVTSVGELEDGLARHREELGHLTAAIHRLIEVMKREDLLGEDIKEEYKRLIRQKEQLQARCVKLEFDIERRRKRVLDADLIRRSLEDFARLVELLPLEDQKELFQLLLHEVAVEPLDPVAEAAPCDADALTTRIRTRWYRVRISLYQLPGVALVNQKRESSGWGGFGSPIWGLKACCAMNLLFGSAVSCDPRGASPPNVPARGLCHAVMSRHS